MPHPRRDCGLTPASRGRFPSRRSYYPRRHVQVKAEQAKSLEEDVQRGIFILATAKLKVKRAVRGSTSKIGRLRSALDEAWSSFLMRCFSLYSCWDRTRQCLQTMLRSTRYSQVYRGGTRSWVLALGVGTFH